MPALDGARRDTREGGAQHSTIELPPPESPVWLPSLSAPRTNSPNTTLGALHQHQHAHHTQHGHTWARGPPPGNSTHHPKPHSPTPLTSQSLAGLAHSQQQTSSPKAGKFTLPKARDMPAAHLARAPRDTAGLYTMDTLPTVDVPGMRQRRPKVRLAVCVLSYTYLP